MKLNRFVPRNQACGYALIITLCFLAVMLIVFASMMSWTTSNSNLTERNNLYNQTELAAESATETVMASMIRDFRNNGGLSGAATYASLFPSTNGWPIPFTFYDTNGNPNQTSVSIGTNGWSNPQNLTGFGSTCVIVGNAGPVGQRYNFKSQVTQNVWFGNIPLFQYAIFYNMDMEINPGNTMTVNGRVHSNQHIWTTGNSASQLLTYNGLVDAVNTIMATNGPLDPRNPKRSGFDAYTISANNPKSSSESVVLPVGTSNNNSPTNVLAILNPPPAGYSPPNYSSMYSTNGLVYLENESDLIITNSSNGTNGTFGTNISVYYQNAGDSANPIVPIQGDVLVSSNVTTVSGVQVTNLVWAYSFVTNGSFYDYREDATVQSVDIDVGKLNAWMTTGAGSQNTHITSGTINNNHKIRSIYAINGVLPAVRSTPTASVLPAVRMLDGQQLPGDGLTVSTPDPIYVKGNYNVTTNGVRFSTALGDTTNTYPAALMGDSITLLSSNWSDGNTINTLLNQRNPVNTTLNAATLEGIVPSNGHYYSGGVENFLRLLENWGSNTVYYNGSIVVMFPSQYATNGWGVNTNIYNAPTRSWGFDLNFMTQSKLPPLTPKMVSVLRLGWSSP